MAYDTETARPDFARMTPEDLDTGPVPCEPYISSDWFELERERVFGRAWLCMGRVEQLPEPNSFITREVEICKALVLITRDKDDNIRAFHNVCSHRLNMLVTESSGKRSIFNCRYHNWTYRNNGDCTGIPDIKNFFRCRQEAVRPHANSLRRVAGLHLHQPAGRARSDAQGIPGPLCRGL